MSSVTPSEPVPNLQEDLGARMRFLDKCRPRLEKLEQIRLEKLKTLESRKKLAVPIGVVMTPFLGFIDYWLILFQSGNDDTAAGVSIAGLAMLWGWVTQPKRQYARAYKTKILPEIARLFGDFRYAPKGKIRMQVLKPSKIVPQHQSYSSEDYFEGEYKSVGIHFSEIKLTKKSGRSTVTVFQGLAVLLTHGTRKFHGHTILTKDQGKIGEWFKSRFSNLDRADLVDPEFERLFDVYTNDQVEARFLIDPLIVENLKTLHDEYSGTDMMAAFYQGHFLILIGSHKNHFEPSNIHVQATNEESLLSMHREISQILSIVDRLSLYDRRALKRSQRAAASA
ncbi:MAG: DUF3137 domain-containing protein [Pseudomonadota bacterium]